MADKDSLGKKNKSLKLAIERYNTYKKFADAYKSTNKLTDYVEHIRSTSTNLSEGLLTHYESMIYSYEHGNPSPLLENLFDRLLAADEYKTKVAEELKSLLREL